MALNFPVIYGSGGGSGYVEDGLVCQDVNALNLSQLMIRPSVSLTDCTGELCYSATGVGGAAGGVGRIAIIAGIVLCLNTGLAAPEADYGLQVFYGNEYNATALIPINGLMFGADKHTYTVKQSGTRTDVYFDGVLVGGYDNLNGRTTATGGIDFSTDNTFTVTGEYYNMRVYNRALTAAEIAANYAEDMRRYG